VILINKSEFFQKASVVARTLLGQQDLCKSQALKMEFTNQIVYTEKCIFELWDKFTF